MKRENNEFYNFLDYYAGWRTNALENMQTCVFSAIIIISIEIRKILCDFLLGSMYTNDAGRKKPLYTYIYIFLNPFSFGTLLYNAITVFIYNVSVVLTVTQYASILDSKNLFYVQYNFVCK